MQFISPYHYTIISQCMFQAWYMAVDTQMFFVAPFFIYTMWHWRRLGPTLTALASIVSLIIPAVITYKDSLDPTMLFYAKYVVYKSLKLLFEFYFCSCIELLDPARGGFYFIMWLCFVLVFRYIII